MEETIEKLAELYRIIESTGRVKVCVVDIKEVSRRYFAGEKSVSQALEPARFNAIASLSGVELSAEFSQFRVFKRQIEWICGRIAFKLLDDLFLGGGHLVARRESGEPYIVGAQNHLSISHSGDFAAAAVSLDESVNGIDLEKVRSFSDRAGFLRVAFPEDNHEVLINLPDEELMTLWTLKECFLKIIGRGFGERLGDVKILPDGFEYKKQRFDSFTRQTERFDNHILSIISCDRDTAYKCRELFNIGSDLK